MAVDKKTGANLAVQRANGDYYVGKKSLHYRVFPGGHPSKYQQGSMLLNFSDRTRTGAFNVIWPLAKAKTIFLLQEARCNYE